MVVLSVLFALCLLVSVSASYIPPGKLWFIAFFGLLFIPLLLLNFIILIFWIVVRLRHAAIPFVAILFSIPILIHTFGFHFSKQNEKTTDSSSIKLMSYNVRNFDLYNWEKNNNTKKNIYKMLSDEQPDILCFQEFYSSDNDYGWENEKDITKLLQLPFHYFYITNTAEKFEHWGLCTYSRFPIISKGTVSYNGKQSNACCYTDIKTSGGIIRVYNIHLQSFHLNYKDYDVIGLKKDSSLNFKAGKSIFSKMKHAFVTRGAQVKVIAEHIRSSPYPVFICGDFNDVPSSFAYTSLRGNLQDAFLKKSWGTGFTYDYWFPIFRIDYLLIDSRWDVNSFKVIGEDLSDHYPVVSIISPASNK